MAYKLVGGRSMTHIPPRQVGRRTRVRVSTGASRTSTESDSGSVIVIIFFFFGCAIVDDKLI